MQQIFNNFNFHFNTTSTLNKPFLYLVISYIHNIQTQIIFAVHLFILHTFIHWYHSVNTVGYCVN